jgi:hypothetical protein
MTDDRFDALINEMREEPVSPEQSAEARDRVWRKLSASTSSVCPEFRPQLEDYRAGRLLESRRLLIEDHLSRCPDCRRVFAEAKGERKVAVMPPLVRRIPRTWAKWAIAAGLAAIAVYAGRDRIDSALAPGGPRATVVSVKGQLYSLSAPGIVQTGAPIEEGQAVRTGPGSRAVLKLMDGSLVEVNERTELAVHAAWSGQTVRLERGDLILQAAKQRRGHLRVATRDTVASVKGTIFAVSSGSPGSLVSVVEGQVDVAQPGANRVLDRGQQAATNDALENVPVRESIAWSQDADKYYALLADLMTIEKQLAEMPGPALRTQPKLLRHLPANAHIYGAVPNLSGAVRDALRLIDQRARDSAVLNEWWTSNDGKELRRLLDTVQSVTPLLGEEVVFMLAQHPTNPTGEVPMLMAEVQPGRRAALQQALDKVIMDTGERIEYRLTDDLMLISESPESLAFAQAMLGTGAASPFASEIARRYQRGAGWLLGLNIQSLPNLAQPKSEHVVLGLNNMRYVFFEHRSSGGIQDNEATLSFQGARTGIASWLATPGPLGSSEYLPADAVFAISASTRNPRQAFDELTASLGSFGGELDRELREFETETGVNVGNDIAGALGADFTFIIERPSIPMPSWLAAAEVLQPAVLDATIRRIVDAANRKAEGRYQLTLGQESVNGRAWSTLKSSASAITVYWTYDRGYLIASTDRATAARAIATREAGAGVVRTARFQQQLPASGSVHYSSFLWINTQGALRDLAGLVQNPAIKGLLENRDPVLVVLNGETERIHAASRTRLTSLILDLMVVHGPRGPQPGAQTHRMEELKAVR